MGTTSDKIIRVGVISDSHLPDTNEAWNFLRELVDECLAPVDAVLHAGDLVAPELLEAFGGCLVYAVRGNMDPASPDVPIKRVIEIGRFRIGLMHGWGPAEGIEDRLLDEFSEERIDCLVYGHSHQPVCHRRDGVLLFNPGSPTDRRSAAFHSIGLLEIDADEIRGSIIRLD